MNVLEVAQCPKCNGAESFRHIEGTSQKTGKAYNFWACSNKSCDMKLSEYGGDATPPSQVPTQSQAKSMVESPLGMREKYVTTILVRNIDYFHNVEGPLKDNPMAMHNKTHEDWEAVKSIARGEYKKKDVSIEFDAI